MSEWRIKRWPFYALMEVDWVEVTHVPSGLWGFASRHTSIQEMKFRILERLNKGGDA